MKHFLPRLAKGRRSLFAVLSARVGSITDNHLGGWYSYRASKAALNQLVKTASVELSRTNPSAACLALHPGTVETPLSAPFHRAGLPVKTPQEAACDLLAVLDRIGPGESGAFLDYAGNPIPF
jgi:NAD(P)-dependent dehydrogenase (short-subunit alcohol dehydrogenase family)